MNQHLTTGRVADEMAARGYRVFRGPDVAITGGAADSRNARPGDLFTAYRGENVDGNEYVAAALANGAVAAICERAPEPLPGGKTVVVAPDATQAIGELAQAWRREVGARVVGITGTVGKTTAKELTAAALEKHFRTHKSEGNFNSREGLPLAVMSLRRDHEVSVLEMGMDRPGEIEELCEIAEPVVGVVLNIGRTHVSKLGSVEAITREKLSLVRWLPEGATAVMNADDALVAEAMAGLRCRVTSFGEAKGAILRCGPVSDLGLAGTEFDVTHEGETRRVRSPLPGAHVVPAALAAIGAGIALGRSFAEAADAVGAAEAEGRVKVLRTSTGATVLDDRYNASPASMAGALRMLGGLGGKRVALIGRMAELGEFEEEEHRTIGRVAAETCDVLAAVGEECRVTIEEARAAGLAEARWFSEKKDAAAYVRSVVSEGDHVLVKASRGAAFETILPILEATT